MNKIKMNEIFEPLFLIDYFNDMSKDDILSIKAIDNKITDIIDNELVIFIDSNLEYRNGCDYEVKYKIIENDTHKFILELENYCKFEFQAVFYIDEYGIAVDKITCIDCVENPVNMFDKIKEVKNG